MDKKNIWNKNVGKKQYKNFKNNNVDEELSISKIDDILNSGKFISVSRRAELNKKKEEIIKNKELENENELNNFPTLNENSNVHKNIHWNKIPNKIYEKPENIIKNEKNKSLSDKDKQIASLSDIDSDYNDSEEFSSDSDNY